MKTAATYYIEVDTYWQNSKSYFVGPFESRQAAEAWVENPPEHMNPFQINLWRSDSMCGGDIKSAWRIYPNALSKTEAKKRGMRDEFGNGYNIMYANTEPTASALDQASHDLAIFA